MKAALMSKVAWCVCPTAIVATSVATVPKLRHAVHQATSKHGERHAKANAQPTRKSARLAAAQIPCPPALLAALGPIVPALAMPDGAAGLGGQPSSIGDFSLARSFPGGGGVIGVGGFGGGGSGGGGGGGGGGGSTATDGSSGGTTGTSSGGTDGSSGGTTVVTNGVPEPASWFMMVGGFAVAGGALRMARRRRHGLGGGYRLLPAAGLAFGSWMPLRAKTALGTVAVSGETAGVVATTAKMGVLAKAALCVCPPALIAGTIATVPPVRHAVYNATAPAAKTGAAIGNIPAVAPCDPSSLAKPVIEASEPETINAFSARVVTS